MNQTDIHRYIGNRCVVATVLSDCLGADMTVIDRDPTIADVSYGLCDADQHYYEPRDSFTRHIEPAFRDVAIHPVIDEQGREIMASGDRRSIHDVKIFDEVARPGSLRELLKKFKTGEGDNDSYQYQPMQPAYQALRCTAWPATASASVALPGG